MKRRRRMEKSSQKTCRKETRRRQRADLFFIQTVEQYPGGCDDMIDQGQEEQSEGARQELASEIENISQYDTVFLGYKKLKNVLTLCQNSTTLNILT